MPLTRLSALLLVGQLVTVALAQGCPQWAGIDTCARANEIRFSAECQRGGPTGTERPINDPPTSQYTACMCYSTYYSMVSACELCQNRAPVTWGVWHSNCKEATRNANDPDDYPDISYPPWARLVYQDSETFSAERAIREGGISPPPPQSPTVQQPTSSLAQATSTRSAAATSPDPSPSSQTPHSSTSNTTSVFPEEATRESTSSASEAPSRPTEATSTAPTVVTETHTRATSTSPNLLLPNPSDDPLGLGSTTKGRGADNAKPGQEGISEGTPAKPINVGAIVGGVVGGLFLILVIAGLLYFFVLRRRRKRIAPSAAYMAQFGDSRVLSPRPFTPDPAGPVPLHSTSSSIEHARPESPTLPRPSTDFYPQQPSPDKNIPLQDPFNPLENPGEMRESNNMSRQSTRRYTRTPTPLIGPRAIR